MGGEGGSSLVLPERHQRSWLEFDHEPGFGIHTSASLEICCRLRVKQIQVKQLEREKLQQKLKVLPCKILAKKMHDLK